MTTHLPAYKMIYSLFCSYLEPLTLMNYLVLFLEIRLPLG